MNERLDVTRRDPVPPDPARDSGPPTSGPPTSGPADPGAAGGSGRETGRATRRGGARRGVVEIVVGTLAGQGLIVAASPLLSRLYTPADFALLQIFTGVVSVGAVVASLRLELAIPLARDARETRAVLRAGLVGTGAMAVVLWLAGLATAGWWTVGDTLVDLHAVWWLVPLTVAAIAVFQLVSAVLIRAERYRDLAGRNAAQGIATVGVQVGLGAVGVHLGLLLGMGLGRLAGLAAVVRRGLHASDTHEDESHGGWSDMVAALRRFRRFPLVTTWTALVNNVGQYAPYLLFSLTYGADPTGWLAFTGRLLGVPAAVVGQAVAQVFLGRGASARRGATGELPRLTWLAVRRLALLGAGPTLAVVALAPWAYGWVFGAGWERAGTYAQVLAVAFFAQFVASPISNVFNLVERQGLALVWEVVRLVMVVAAPTLAWALGGSDLVGVAAFAVALVLSYGGVLTLVWWVLRRA